MNACLIVFYLKSLFVWLFLMTCLLIDDCCTCFKHLLSWTLGWLLHLVMHWMWWKMMGVEHCRKWTQMTNDKFNFQVTTDLTYWCTLTNQMRVLVTTKNAPRQFNENITSDTESVHNDDVDWTWNAWVCSILNLMVWLSCCEMLLQNITVIESMMWCFVLMNLIEYVHASHSCVICYMCTILERYHMKV